MTLGRRTKFDYDKMEALENQKLNFTYPNLFCDNI